MSLVAMKRLSVIVPLQRRRTVMRRLYREGCVELERQETPPEHLTLRPENTNAERDRQTLEQALTILMRVAPAKKSLLAPRRAVEEQTLFDHERVSRAVERALEINTLWERYEAAKNHIARLHAQELALSPWKELDVPLGFTGTEHMLFTCGVLSAQTVFEDVEAVLASLPAQLTKIGADTEQTYCALLCLRDAEKQTLDVLKPFGFSKMAFRESGTAKQELTALAAQIAAEEKSLAESERAVAALGEQRPLLEDASDALESETGCDRLLSETPCTKQTVYLTGWVPEKRARAVGQTLEALGCAWESRDPEEGETPPTAMDDGPVISAFGSVSAMYGTPAYGSIIDPNPIMTPFYIVFFGFIMGDAAYGLLMFFGCLLALKKMKPTGGTRNLLTVFMYCGLSTILAGALTGGWFADAVKVFSGTFLGREVTIRPIWFDPLQDPVKMLIFALILGAIQILTGMALAAWRQIKEGDPLGAFFDIGSWYILFAGIGLFAGGFLGGLPTMVGIVGKWMAIGGALLIVCTAGRSNKGLGKVTGGLGALYGITGYLSDLLSYSRIMALGLSGAVVGQVFNKMGTMGGRSIIGVLVFLFAFVVGHVFNLVISLLGAYVHTTRLQYIEFFGRFFQDGGHPFKPLFHKTKYVDVIREE
ncbi:MAG: V-type ATP synthase subunit I [Clostridiaceae bacterium]|nr:V-type ATP synthase subunit I [Clostridiaceae bacterium]